MGSYMDFWSVVDSVKKDLELNTDIHDLTFYKYCQDEFRELVLAGQIDYLAIKTVKIDLDHNGIGALPADYGTWLKVGNERCGRILWYMYNSNLLNLPENCCAEQEFQNCANQWDSCNPNENPSSPFWSNYYQYGYYYHNNQFVGGAFGQSANINFGAFNIDESTNTIIARGWCNRYKEVMLQYRTDMSSYGINGIVTDNIIQALVYGVHWNRVRFRSESADVTLRPLVKQYRRERVIAWNRVLARKSSFTMETFLDVYRRGIVSVPKR